MNTVLHAGRIPAPSRYVKRFAQYLVTYLSKLQRNVTISVFMLMAAMMNMAHAVVPAFVVNYCLDLLKLVDFALVRKALRTNTSRVWRGVALLHQMKRLMACCPSLIGITSSFFVISSLLMPLHANSATTSGSIPAIITDYKCYMGDGVMIPTAHSDDECTAAYKAYQGGIHYQYCFNVGGSFIHTIVNYPNGQLKHYNHSCSNTSGGGWRTDAVYTCSSGTMTADRICLAPKQRGEPPACFKTPYPIHAGTGNKYWSDNDYQSTGSNRLNLVRHYNSQNTSVGSTMGIAWRHAYDRFITADMNTAIPILATRPNGTAYPFVLSGSNYVSQDADVTDKLIRIVDANGKTTGWTYSLASDDSTETYDATGKLVSIQDRVGMVQILTYSDATTPSAVAPKPGLLIRVADSFGRQLNLTYGSAGRINKMMDPAGRQYLYQYDASNNLTLVTYPDTKVKQYLYNEAAYTNGASLPNALTGVMDENGIRFASYYYNAEGKATGSQHAGGVDQYQLAYNINSTVITDPLGVARTYNYQTILGVDKVTSLSQPGGAGCNAASTTLTYDANGNVASRTDFNGNLTSYSYDLARNLETVRVEAAGTPLARTVTTQWHATYRLPTLIAEPLRITTHTYDASGNLLTKTVQATADATGAQGASAAVGAARTWSYTYNAVGQVLTVRGPRTDVTDLTTHAYDAAGNLVTVTNALGHVTTLSNYDANGRVGTIADPNGTTTTMTYSPRGWLTSRSVTGAGGVTETTSYSYDGVGQLTKVTQPGGSFISYSYDPAHRLTGITDSLGNSIAYTLDTVGNRINEQVKDPAGVLARQTTRIYDALNRLQQVTGGIQ